ncbi:MAG: hypothetical protein ACE1Y2_01075 [Stenotrophomonas maltophilia]
MANPHWNIWVDWDADGIWGKANEDVTPDLMRLHWEWGRELTRDRARPALLKLELRNDDHKYSPPNSGSPLAGNLKAGRRVWARFAYPYDDFTGMDSTDLAGRTPPVDQGFTWIKENSGGNGFEIFGNQVRELTGGASDAIYTLDLGDADAYIGFRYNRATNGGGGAVLRFISTSDYLRVRFLNSDTVLEDVTGGTPSNIRSGDALTVGVNYFVEIEMHGSSIRLFATDLDAGTVERREILDGAVAAGNTEATKHGLWHNGSANTDRWDDFGGWRSFFYGLVDRIVPNPGPGGESCEIRAFDELDRLDNTLVFNLLTGLNLRSDTIANNILTWANFSFNDRELDLGRILIAKEPRAVWRSTARAALNRLQDEEDGFLYIDGLGFIRLEVSSHRSSGSHATSRATLQSSKASSPYISELSWDDGSDGVENDVTFRYHLEDNQNLQEIWKLRDVPAIPAGATRDFLAESTAFDVVDSIRVPVATTDYTANSQADGGGTDMTGDLTVTLPLISSYQGRGTIVRVTNNHGSDTAFITLLRLRADKSYKDFESTIYQTSDNASQNDHGTRSHLVDCRYIDTYDTAKDVADSRLARKKDGKTRLNLVLPNGDKNNLLQMVHRVLSDRITVVYSDMGINEDFFIEHMSIDAIASTGEVTTRWKVKGI